MIDVIIILILLAILGGAGLYIYRAKKSGKKCIGCPDAAACGAGSSTCTGSCAGCSCGCGKAE